MYILCKTFVGNFILFCPELHLYVHAHKRGKQRDECLMAEVLVERIFRFFFQSHLSIHIVYTLFRKVSDMLTKISYVMSLKLECML